MDNEVVTKFEDLEKMGVDHFHKLFKEDENVSKEKEMKLSHKVKKSHQNRGKSTLKENLAQIQKLPW